MAEDKKSGPEAEDVSLLAKLEEIREALVIKTSDEVTDLLRLSRSTRRILVTNFLLGLSRGVGFFIGVSFLGAMILGVGVLLATEAVSGLAGSDTSAEVEAFFGKLNVLVDKASSNGEKEQSTNEQEEGAPELPKENGQPEEESPENREIELIPSPD